MDLVEKLKRRAKELEHKVRVGVTIGDYPAEAADDRELLEAAIRHIAHLELDLTLHRCVVEHRPLPVGFTPMVSGARYG